VAEPKLSALELRIMSELWTRGACSIREIHEAVVKRDKPAYTTVQTMVYRLEAKGAVRRVRKIGNAHVFEATTSRASVQTRLLKELLGLFGGNARPVMAPCRDGQDFPRGHRRRAETPAGASREVTTGGQEQMTHALIDHLWQSTLFGALIGSITLAMRANSAAVRHWLWQLASLKFLVPFSALQLLGALADLSAPVEVRANSDRDGDGSRVARHVTRGKPGRHRIRIAGRPAAGVARRLDSRIGVDRTALDAQLALRGLAVQGGAAGAGQIVGHIHHGCRHRTVRGARVSPGGVAAGRAAREAVATTTRRGARTRA
jgi:predicted transcriptional regulator